jgi:hypothetical protein
MRWIAPAFLLIALATAPAQKVFQSPSYEREFHSAVPLGAERIDLRPARNEMYVLATAESPQFEGWRVREDGERKILLAADGQPVRFYPQRVNFRVTATAMRPKLLMIDSYGTLNLSDDSINSFLLSLRFRLLVFRGLDVARLEPRNIRMIGMPAEVPYDERVYGISFDLPRPVPMDERVVLEVLSATGTRLCKFHLDFF